MARPSFVLASVCSVALATKCGTWCEDNGHASDACDCGVCGSFGACSFSCTEGMGRVACPTVPTPDPAPVPVPEPTPDPTPTPVPDPTPAPPSPAPTPITPGISKDAVTIGGLVCDGIQDGSVFYPNDMSKKYPLLAFAHGWTEGGQFTDGNYKDVIESVAAAGYVVIAHHSGLVTECQPIYPKDQQRALAYIKETPKYADMVDWDIKHGIYGHSMGGGATGDNAGNQAAIDTYNLGAAVLLHPVATGTHTLIPSFYATGSADTICAPSGAESWSKTAAKPYIFAEMTGATHFECQTSENGIPCPAGWTNYVVNWFNCHLKGMQEECNAASEVCTHPTKAMTKTSCQLGTFSNHTVV